MIFLRRKLLPVPAAPVKKKLFPLRAYSKIYRKEKLNKVNKIKFANNMNTQIYNKYNLYQFDNYNNYKMYNE